MITNGFVKELDREMWLGIYILTLIFESRTTTMVVCF